MAALRLFNTASKLEEEFEIEFELTLIALRAPSTLADEVERLTDEPCRVVIAALVVARAASTLEDEFEREREEV